MFLSTIRAISNEILIFLTLQVSDSLLPGLAFGFPDNETDLPQEAKTVTTISWQPIPETTEYEVSCNPLTLEERGFQVFTLTHLMFLCRTPKKRPDLFIYLFSLQMRLPGTSNSATLIGLTSGASYNVVVEAMKDGAKETVLEDVIKVGNAGIGFNVRG